MKIGKALNNYVAVVIENNEEKIVMGRGISFKKKKGDNQRNYRIFTNKSYTCSK